MRCFAPWIKFQIILLHHFLCPAVSSINLLSTSLKGKRYIFFIPYTCKIMRIAAWLIVFSLHRCEILADSHINLRNIPIPVIWGGFVIIPCVQAAKVLGARDNPGRQKLQAKTGIWNVFLDGRLGREPISLSEVSGVCQFHLSWLFGFLLHESTDIPFSSYMINVLIFEMSVPTGRDRKI